MKVMKYIIGILTAAIFLASCTNLDEEVFSDITTENYYQTSDNIYAALARNYVHSFSAGWSGAGYFLQEVTADQLIVPTRGKHGYNGGEYVRLHEHKWTVNEAQIYSIWRDLNQGIGFTNRFIEDFENINFTNYNLTEETKQTYISELRGLRAWYYIFLIDLFREVPIVTNIYDVKEQSSSKDVFDFIERELLEVLPQLPQKTTSSRLNQASIASLLVRIYLNSEQWTGISRYDDCEKIAMEIIDGNYGKYTLDSSYTGPFRSGINGYNSPENIFQFDLKRNYLEPSWLYNMWMHYQSRYALDNDFGGWNGGNISPSRDLNGNLYNHKLGMTYEKFPEGDFRRKPFIVTSAEGAYEGFFLMGQQYHFDYDKGYGYTDEIITGSEEYNGKPLVFVDQVGLFAQGEEGLAKGSHLVYGEENTGYRLMKFPWLPQSKDLFFSNAIPEIRLSEIYYSLAESKYRAGEKMDAAKLLDAVRKRYYNDQDWTKHSYELNINKLTDEEFIDEWGREFLGERRRRIDLVRWGLFSSASWWDKSPDESNKDIFPIPERALNANPLLKQTTPGF